MQASACQKRRRRRLTSRYMLTVPYFKITEARRQLFSLPACSLHYDTFVNSRDLQGSRTIGHHRILFKSITTSTAVDRDWLVRRSPAPCGYVVFCLSIREYTVRGGSSSNAAFMQPLPLSAGKILYVGLPFERVDEPIRTAIMPCTRFTGVQLCLDLLRQ